MCGIFGWIDPSVPAVSDASLATLRDVMASRGPDGNGTYREAGVALAMRRLSVVDLEHGSQPRTSAEGRVVAFQNGEIYNHEALRRDLEVSGYRFETRSDTEVLAHGYAHWGIEGLLERIDGMYALAILDRKARVLHLARDRFGEKPLYCAGDGRRFAYSSHLVALAALPWVDVSIDASDLDRYLALHYVPGDRTILSGVWRLLPGTRAEIAIDAPSPRVVRYYRPGLSRVRGVPDDELAELLERAVASRLMADVPVGVFLSGGLDSSVIALLAARHSPGITTFSMGFDRPELDESAKAEVVARAIGSRHRRFQFTGASFLELLPEVAAALDEPLGDQALLPVYWLCREARREVTVVLSGEGADEVFAGYGYYGDAVTDWERDLVGPCSLRTPSGFPVLTTPDERLRLTGAVATPGAWERELLGWLATAAGPLQRATAADLGSWLPDDLLVKFDRMSMAHSLEGRAPYLAPGVVEAGLGLPPEDRLANGTAKVALRRLGRRWLPPAISEARKQGFVLPMESWLREWFQTRGGASSYFADGETGGMDPRIAAALVETDLAAGLTRQRLLFALVALVEWERAFRAKVSGLRRTLWGT